ncbi:hypothetical protein [Metabacillus indicus]|uniref:hypothetical protein n=1 Tax=Metabacillus indicus TaxID=246786 RepID=UPI000AC2CD14|nr:hypothetical protein [Metabacillus indicus]
MFLLLCKKVGLAKDDLEDMTVGMCLDYIDEYLNMQKPKKQIRKANQNDFDAF